MSLDALPSVDPAAGDIITVDLVETDGVLVKLFALGPDTGFEPHHHDDVDNVFHLLAGTVIVTQDGTDERIDAPAVIHNPPGAAHGARNESTEPALLTASLSPHP